MPYCPKCDMEFVEGITICSDCGGPLVESEDAYRAELQRLKEEALEKRRLEAQREFTVEELLSEADRSGATLDPDWAERVGIEDPSFRDSVSGRFDAGENWEPSLGDSDGRAAGRPDDGRSDIRAASKPASPGLYVTSRQRCEDMHSSASAFLLVGGVILIASILCWVGIIRLPMSDGSRMFFQTVLTAMGIASLIVSLKTRSSIAGLREKAEEEERCTAELIRWFTDSWNGMQLDQELLKEDPSLEGPELELKRFELIQDYLITKQDLPNQSYVEFLSEEIYGRLYGDGGPGQEEAKEAEEASDNSDF